MEKVLVSFENKLPSSGIKQFLVTPEVVDNPEGELKKLLEQADTPELSARFDAVGKQEIEEIKKYIAERTEYYKNKSGIALSDQRLALIAGLYSLHITDIDSAIENFEAIHNQIQSEAVALRETLDVNIILEDSAIDHIIEKAMNSGEDAGRLTFQLAKRLEYGLRLVKDRSGMDDFVITADALKDMEGFINELMKKAYDIEKDTAEDEQAD